LKKGKYKAIIIGAGQIGATYDNPNSKDILTHANAYKNSKEISEIAFVDTDKQSLDNACKKWDSSGFNNLEEALQRFKPEIISVCVPSESHYDSLKRIADFKPKLVLSEKPITLKPKLSKEICEIYEQNNILLSVNYTRRFDKYIHTLKEKIINNSYGEILNCSIIYTKGILNNGCHVLNLIEYLFGIINSYKVLRQIEDYNNPHGDKTLDAWVTTQNCSSVHIIGASEKAYSILEMDILFEKIRINYNQFGLKVTEQHIRRDPIFEGYQDLEEGINNKTNLNLAIREYIHNGIQAIQGAPLISSARSALNSEELCHEMLATSQKI
jgi:predicted dehydrogenase